MFKLFLWSIVCCLFVTNDLTLAAGNFAEDESPVSLKNGTFVRNNRYVYFTGPFDDWTEKTVRDRRGPWSQHSVYAKPNDRQQLDELGFNTFQPINFTSYFIMKKHYPHVMERVAFNGMNDYFREAEDTAKLVLQRVKKVPLIMDYSDIGLFLGFGKKAKGVVPDNYFQKNDNWDDFFPFDPSVPGSFELYRTLFRDATRFVVDNGGNPLIYELLNEPFYNSFSAENQALFQTFLKNKYADIAVANRTWGTRFPSFSEAVVQVVKVQHLEPGPWYDWMYFQSRLLAGYLQNFRSIILEADTRKTAKFFTYQAWHQVSSMQYNNAFNDTFTSDLDIVGVEYCGPEFGRPQNQEKNHDPMASGFSGTNERYFLGGALAKAYSGGKRPIIDFEMRCVRIGNGERVPSHDGDLETALWHELMYDFSGSIVYTWGNRSWEWKTFEEATAVARKAPYCYGYLLNPFNYPESALFGLKRFREQVDSLSEIVMPKPRVIGKVGVIYLDHQSWQLPGREWQDYAACHQALNNLQMPNDFIIAEFLADAGDLKRFPVIFCPLAEFVPEKTRRILQDYVDEGGILISSFNAFTHDEYGRPTDPSPLLGLRFSSSVQPKRADRLCLATTERESGSLDSYELSGGANSTTAQCLVSGLTSAQPLIMDNRLGKGHVYTLLTNRGSNGMGGIYELLLTRIGVKRDGMVTEPDSECMLTDIQLNLIDRGESLLWHAVNWSTLTRSGKLRILKPVSTPMYVYDAISGKRLPAPSGGTTWKPAELAAGITIALPSQERVLWLLTSQPWKGEKGVTSAQELQDEIARRRAADLAEQTALLKRGESAKQQTIQQRTFKEIDPEFAFGIDLRQHVNMGFKDAFAGDDVGGCTDQGPQNDLAGMPTGKQLFYGVPYTIIDPVQNNGKSMIALRGGDRKKFPASAMGIPVNRKAAALYFLHATAWTVAKKPMFCYVIHYEDGNTVKIPIVQYSGVDDWWRVSDLRLKDENVRVAWEGRNSASEVGLFSYRWRNPYPEKNITRLDVESFGMAVPLVVAITGVSKTVNNYDPTEKLPFLLNKKLNPNFTVKAWGAAPPVLTPGAAGKLVLTALPKVGSWGGIILQAAPGSGVSVGDGEWQLQLQLNYDSRNAFNQVEGVPTMQLLIPKDNAKKPKEYILQPALDSDPDTWETRCVDLGKGPLELNQLSIQYRGNNPPGSIKVREIVLVKKNSN